MFVIIFDYIPMYGVIIAFKDYQVKKGITGSEWVGMKHFIQFFNTTTSLQIIWNTVATSLYSIIASFPFPIALAILLNDCRYKGLKKSTRTFGSDRFSPEQVSAAVKGAIRCGYRLFHCAAIYGNETQIGKIFADAFSEGIVKRDELFITSKVWNDMHGQGEVLLSIAQTLKDLQLDYTNAFFAHWPFPNYYFPGCDGDSRSPYAVPFSPECFIVP